MAAQDVVLARKGPLLLLGETRAHNRRRGLVLLKLNPCPVAVMAIENGAVLVDVDRHHDAALRDVGLKHLEPRRSMSGMS